MLKVISTLKYSIENEKADIQGRKDVKGDKFRMKIGEIGGFDLKIHYEPTYIEKSGTLQVVHKNIELQLVNHGSYNIKTPTIKGIEIVLNNSPERLLKNDSLELSSAQDELKKREQNISKPFAQQAELDETCRKFEEIEEKISVEENSDRAEENSVEENISEEIQEPTDENNSDEKNSSETSTQKNLRLESLRTQKQVKKFRAQNSLKKLTATNI